MKILLRISFACAFCLPILVFAHPGNTASDGAHYCRTNCDSWGVPWNERHSHGGGSTYSSNYYSSDYYRAPTTPSCPSNSYASGTSCKCNYGYVVSGTQCISGSSYCSAQIGLMSTYNSIDNSCSCLSGYEIGASGVCTYKKPTYQNSYSGYKYSPTEASCPAHSSVSSEDPDKCSCNTGYSPDTKKK